MLTKGTVQSDCFLARRFSSLATFPLKMMVFLQGSKASTFFKKSIKVRENRRVVKVRLPLVTDSPRFPFASFPSPCCGYSIMHSLVKGGRLLAHLHMRQTHYYHRFFVERYRSFVRILLFSPTVCLFSLKFRFSG